MNRLALPLLLLPALAQASFLGDLATNANRVAASPCATGGDLVLKLSEAEYVHVFTNTASAGTFTPAQALTARVLVVGGGGPGDWGQKGWTGGGGAGGMVERSGIALEAGTDYAVTVGAGGDMRMSATRVSGGNSAFGSITARGGGYGGGNGWGAAKGGDGGSGGGAQYNEGVSGGSGTDGQGNAGGAIVVSSGKSMCGGGGGAGFAGADITAANILGHGGDGLESDILGFDQHFAGGGAGGGTFHALVRGGRGGGGTPYANGEDGLGGGGGAASGAKGTKGGDGIVAVRYVDPAFAAPSVADVAVSLASPRTAVVSGRLACVGAGASSATAAIDVWPTSDPAAVATTVLAANLSEGGSFSGVLAGLSRDTAYSWSLHAENDDSVPSTAVTGSFTTWSDSLAASSTGAETSTIGHDTVLLFTNATTGGTFTPTGSGIARILVVGGGGSGGGWCGGGGGAGGLVYDAAAYFEAGKTYDVTVGAGGVFGTSATWKQGVSGGDSSIIADSGATVVAQAKGGGGGGNRNATGYGAGGMAGGSGGGGGNNNTGIPGFGTSGQGNDGGIALAPTYFGGGGGGAGGPGGNGTAAKAGDGGAGVAYSITGESVVYAAGGGGGACYTSASVACDESTAGKGGSGIGGDGEYYRTPYVKAGSGTANTGSGGGGGSGRGAVSNQAGIGGDGADGIVVIRYTDYAAAEQDNTPQLDDLVVTAFDATSATFPVSLVLAGGMASTATITAHWALEGGTTTNSQVLASSFSGTATFTLGGLFPGRPYVLSVEADNGLPDGRATVSCAFSTAPMFSGPLALAATGGTLSYVVDGASDGAQRLELWVGPDAASMTNQATYADAPLMTAGSHAITPFSAEQFGEELAVVLRHVAVADGRAFTNETSVLTATLLDGATYTWRSDVPDGDWCNAANWTHTGGMRGWPTAGSTAIFPAMTSTVRVDRAIVTGTMTFASKDCNLRFLGTSDGASLVSDFGNGGNTPFGKAKIAFDALAFSRPSTQGIKLESATELRVENGATFALSGVLWVSNPDASFTLANGSTMSVSQTANSKGVFTVDDSTYASGKFNLSYQDPAALHVLRGSNARIAVNGGFFAEKAPATIRIELSGDYSSGEALIKETGSSKMAESGGVLTFEAPRSKASDAVEKCDVLVADWTRSSINTSLVEFGEVDREGSYFYYTTSLSDTVRYKSAAEVTAASATAKCIWYHHAPPSGTVLILK